MIQLSKSKLPLNTSNKINSVSLTKSSLHLAILHSLVWMSVSCVSIQSTQAAMPSVTPSTHSEAIFADEIQLFNTADSPSADNISKQVLLQALAEHVRRDQTTVSQMRYQVTPYVDDEIEADSQSLFRTFLELRAYQDKKYGTSSGNYAAMEATQYRTESKPAYRTREDYLQGNEDELYLRYDDEIKDTRPMPDYEVTRAQGMSDEYKARSTAIYYYAYNQDDCVIDYSAALDNLVNEDAEFSIDNEQVAKLDEQYAACTAQVKADYQQPIAEAVGYQMSYAPKQDQCAAMYHDNISHFLAPNRRIKEVNYDEYDSVYQSYRVCYDLVGEMQALEPNDYTYYEKSQAELDFSVAKIRCADDLFAKQERLIADGVTLANSPDQHASIYYNDYNTCVFDAEQTILYAEDEDIASQASNAQKEDSDADTDDTFDNDEYSYEDYSYEEYNRYESGADKFKQDLANFNIQGFLEDYREMKAKRAEQPDDDGNARDLEDILGMGTSLFFLEYLQRTPEQLQARNHYAYKPLRIHTVSRYQPSRQRYSAIYSYDFNTPTYMASVQMPVELDFKQTTLTIDPSALLPIMAIVSPEHTPLPQDMEGKVVSFTLPEGMSDIPTGILQQSFIDAVQDGLGALNPAYFTEFDLANDNFARRVGASRGIKVSLGSKQSGELIGQIIKNLTDDLKTYIDNHPNAYPKDHPIRTTIENWSLYNEGFQSKDVGSVLQFIEAIAPISFDRFNYFYFDSQGQLIAKQSRTDFASYLSQSNYSVVRQSRFDQASFDQAPYANKLNTLFFTGRDSIDGNAWIESSKAQQALTEEARYARYGYDLPDYDDDYDDIYGHDYAEELIETDADADADADNKEEE